MYWKTLTTKFHHLIRQIDPRGFVGDFRNLHHGHDANTRKRVLSVLKDDQNVLFCGHHSTGKLTLLKALGEHCEKKLSKRVAFVSANNYRANRLDGYLLHHFIGLRLSPDELPSQEQLEGTLERHVRLIESTYASSFPSLCNTDVLIFDALEHVPPVVLLSMDAVGRRQRGRPGEPFGGLRVFAAADFWRLPVHPTSGTGGYVFQLDSWHAMFPKQFLLERTHGQGKSLNAFTLKALYGNLSVADIVELERLSFEGKPEMEMLLRCNAAYCTDGQSNANAEELDRESGEGTPIQEQARDPVIAGAEAASFSDNSRDDDSIHDGLLRSAQTPSHDDIVSNADAIMQFTPRFPKQPSIKIMPSRYRQIKRTEIGNFLVTTLYQSAQPISFGLVDALSVEVGSQVHLLLNPQVSYGVKAGALGEVTRVSEHHITVHFPKEHRTIEVMRMRITVFHPSYPEITYELRQFPLFPRNRLCPMAILTYPNTYYANINGRRLADTNDLGNLLSHMRSFDDFTLRHAQDFTRLDGVVHEPTRIYYHEILQKPMTTAPEHWCRNCKLFVPTKDFFAHWNACIKAVRWCRECNKSIPLELLGPHQEKHQVVMCMDCGQAVEWRRWEAHRLSCKTMMREVSPDNEFLPLRTRQLALELGLDKRDLHTMRSFTRSMLPRSREQLR